SCPCDACPEPVASRSDSPCSRTACTNCPEGMIPMSNASAPQPTGGEIVPVKFSRLTRRGVLLGLTLAQLIALAIGGASLVLAFYAGGGILVLYTAPIWLTA